MWGLGVWEQEKRRFQDFQCPTRGTEFISLNDIKVLSKQSMCLLVDCAIAPSTVTDRWVLTGPQGAILSLMVALTVVFAARMSESSLEMTGQTQWTSRAVSMNVIVFSLLCVGAATHLWGAAYGGTSLLLLHTYSTRKALTTGQYLLVGAASYEILAVLRTSALYLVAQDELSLIVRGQKLSGTEGIHAVCAIAYTWAHVVLQWILQLFYSAENHAQYFEVGCTTENVRLHEIVFNTFAFVAWLRVCRDYYKKCESPLTTEGLLSQKGCSHNQHMFTLWPQSQKAH